MREELADLENELKNILSRYSVKKASDILMLIENNEVPPQIAFQEYLEATHLERIMISLSGI